MKWISINDKLPKPSEWVLVAKDIGIMVMCGTYSKHSKAFYLYGDSCPDESITHWMPLPEPPTDLNLS